MDILEKRKKNIEKQNEKIRKKRIKGIRICEKIKNKNNKKLEKELLIYKKKGKDYLKIRKYRFSPIDVKYVLKKLEEKFENKIALAFDGFGDYDLSRVEIIDKRGD